MKSRILLLSALTLAIGSMALHAQQASLQQRMGAEDFKAAGLDKLSPTELQNLEQWLADHDKSPVKMVDASGKPGRRVRGLARQGCGGIGQRPALEAGGR